MLSSPRIRRLLTGIGSSIVLPVVITVAFVDLRFGDVRAFFFDQQVTLTVWVCVAVPAAFLVFAIFLNDRTYQRDVEIAKRAAEIAKRDEDIRRLQQTIETLEGRLDDANQMRFLDYVTGIPNEAKWKIDIARLAASISNRSTPCHIALIDLVAFGQLNDEFGYAKVDEILKHLAHALDDSMRKNEGLYRKQAEDGGLRPDPLYRKYPGGDEFYIVIESSEAEMLGLLARLQQLMSSRIEQHVSDNIAGRKVSLLFSGAVCRLFPDQTPDDVTNQLIAGLKAARYSDSPTRLKWSAKTSADFEPNTIEHRLYRQAEVTFANPPNR